ncbi:hypothetical protein OCC_03973 [Thermococcus litoralis DSM 5473]|uniref:Uncharacterized protein n=1 Tax=Thermococcus litoralis (strain ATCC 51850 / DSM 5473 / JCM 8560 / NS-C) TaxID=523849 RepID=H3ZQE6_THELN|nr:hypothetical protein [Thermococcus litoralis]EHR78179.1 hypothetical protein OCC_03973 [Thermococcus litoralis DSM 5473]
MEDDTKKMGVIIAVMFVVFVLFRVYYQKGRKLLANYHPWDWIGLVVLFSLLGYAMYKLQKKGSEEA